MGDQASVIRILMKLSPEADEGTGCKILGMIRIQNLDYYPDRSAEACIFE